MEKNKMKKHPVRIAVLNLEEKLIGYKMDSAWGLTPEEDYAKLRKLKKHLSKPEIALVKEIVEIKRKIRPVWGV